MGYYAVSSEEVYRHALRLDGRPSLIDRFGFSILLVNDGSDLCRQFLDQFCVDLCLRTADRIRFVFFSGLDERTINEHLVRTRSKRALFQRIVNSMTSVDSELKPWSDLRPRGIQPLDTIESIDRARHGVFDPLRTAMPGVGEAMRFAQRLGIGAAVPCIILFSEVGVPSVQVLPISRRSPHEVYEILRGWIDHFYAANRSAIERWSSVESMIEELSRATRSSLGEIEQWRSRRFADWRDLTAVSSAIAALNTPEPNQWVKASLAAGTALEAATEPLRLAQGRQARAAAEREVLEAVLRSLTEAEDAEEILEALRRVRENLSRDDSTRIVGDGLSTLARLRRAPQQQIASWWRSCSEAFPLSNRRYTDHRRAWEPQFRAVRSMAPTERRVLLDSLGERQLDESSAEVAAAVIGALAGRLSLARDGADLTSVSAAFEGDLVRWVQRMQDLTPGWIVHHAPSATIGDVLPIGESWMSADVMDDRRPLLVSAVHVAESDRAAIFLSAAERLRSEAVIRVRAAAAEVPDLRSVYGEARDRTLAQLQPLRAAIAVRALRFSVAPSFRRPPDRAVLEQLHRTLDEYDRATHEIVF